MVIRGLKAALNANGRYPYKAPESVVDYLVVGGGVVGLAVAQLLSQRYPEKTTYLVERNARIGEETSSRNSEVIHAGLYYPLGSLKASLCIRGRDLMYEHCDGASVPFRKIGKMVVALEHQRSYIESLHEKALKMRWPSSSGAPGMEAAADDQSSSQSAVPTELISGDRARELEPDLSKDITAALLSHETGILDSHAFMESLEKDITESENGELVYSTSVVRVDPYDRSRQATNTLDVGAKEGGWVVQTVTGDASASGGDSDSLLARSLINASGLSAQLILNSLLPPERRLSAYYARGSYAAYNGPGIASVSRLIYPCPDTDKTGHAFQSLGTHLTLDLNGNAKFGPGLQWISPTGSTSAPSTSPHPAEGEGNDRENQPEELFSYEAADIDFWKRHLEPDVTQLEAMHEAVRTYLPGVEFSKFRPDYVGIRPKLVPPWGGFQDFVFRTDYSNSFLRYAGPVRGGPMVSLLGIESPGLTASLAIAEKVVDVMLSPQITR